MFVRLINYKDIFSKKAKKTACCLSRQKRLHLTKDIWVSEGIFSVLWAHAVSIRNHKQKGYKKRDW